MSTENAANARRCFSETEEPYKWKSKCGKQLIKQTDCGWTNLINHIESEHPKYATEGDQQQTSMASYHVTNTGHKIGRSAMNVHGRLEGVCQGLKPFSFVKDPLTQKYTKLGSMARPILLKNMDLLTKEEYSRQDAELVHSNSFQSEIVKLLSTQEEELNEDEKQDVTALFIKDGCPATNFVDSDGNGFVVKCLKRDWWRGQVN